MARDEWRETCWPRDLPLISICLLSFVGMFAVSGLVVSRPQIVWYLPAAVEYGFLPFMWAVKLGFVTFSVSAIATVALLQKQAFRYAILLFCVVLVLCIEVLTRIVHQPLLPELEERVRDGVILQTSSSTCAASACANIAGVFGVAKTEGEMVDALHTNWAGTSPAQIVYGMRSLGFGAQKKTVATLDVREVGVPAVLLVSNGQEADGHAVALVGFEGDSCILLDSGSGRKVVTVVAFRETWAGHAIEISWGGM